MKEAWPSLDTLHLRRRSSVTPRRLANMQRRHDSRKDKRKPTTESAFLHPMTTTFDSLTK